jgi:hypothetical protein
LLFKRKYLKFIFPDSGTTFEISAFSCYKFIRKYITMKELEINDESGTPILIPYQQQLFWETIRKVVREEMISVSRTKPELSVYEWSFQQA